MRFLNLRRADFFPLRPLPLPPASVVVSPPSLAARTCPGGRGGVAPPAAAGLDGPPPLVVSATSAEAFRLCPDPSDRRFFHLPPLLVLPLPP